MVPTEMLIRIRRASTTRQRRWSNPPPSPCTRCAVARPRWGRRRSCSAPGPLGLFAVQLLRRPGVRPRVDTIGADSATVHLGLLAHGGRIAFVAGRPDLTTVPPFGIAPSVHEIALGAAYTVGDKRSRAQLATMLEELLSFTAEGRLDPMLSRTVSLSEVPTALVELSGSGVRGKIVYVQG